MVLVKILTFSLSLLFFKLGLHILFDFVLEKKQGFLDYKNDIRKGRKIGIFSKGLTHTFGQNLTFSLIYLFFSNKPKYTVCLSSREKTTLSRL